MATTTHFGWPAPAQSDTYDIDQYTQTLIAIDDLIFAANQAIEALDVGSDVVDVVGVYDKDNYPEPKPATDLKHYDYTKLKLGDIIKVLQDESQIDISETMEDAPISYYRKIAEPAEPEDIPFSLIGTLGPYTSKIEVQRMMPTVEDVVLPGEYSWVDITTEMLNEGTVLYNPGDSCRSDGTNGDLFDTPLTYNRIIEVTYDDEQGQEQEMNIYTNNGNTWSLSSDTFTAFGYKYLPPDESYTSWPDPVENKNKYAASFRNNENYYPRIYQSRFVPIEP